MVHHRLAMGTDLGRGAGHIRHMDLDPERIASGDGLMAAIHDFRRQTRHSGHANVADVHAGWNLPTTLY
jgi:hypothetical protein